MSSLDHWSSWTNFDTRTQNRSNSEDFVAKVERCVYENEKLSDDEVENECRFWAQRFPHLRIVGKGISSKCEQKDLETLRMSIARKLVKNYLWNSVSRVREYFICCRNYELKSVMTELKSFIENGENGGRSNRGGSTKMFDEGISYDTE
ncbi:unnamed protein product [Toxocara canis]|uniref:DUF3719 domain-containing protein n=1 Tax=Toxocara canis TaxID=6265 RepID=A0A183TVJ8_TOXCA|nr:unnamed protein product [Toxocara canis]